MKISLPAILLAGALAASAATYEIDPAHSSAQFTVKHMMISNVHGQFSKVAGTLEFNDSNPAMASVKATIDASTVNTQEPKRDEHLKSPDFLDVAKFPNITFQSTSFRKVENGKYKVAGDLTIHGVTKRVVLDVDGPTAEVKDPWGNARVGINGTTKISRSDYGLTWNKALEAGGVLVGDEVTITLEVEFVKKNATVSQAHN
jgi:polyisoprenoid-binding protein YceI